MNLRNIYDSRRIWKIALIAVSLLLMTVFLIISNNMVKDLAKQERERMEIWADATKELASMDNEADAMPTDVDFVFSIIERNHNIPVLLVDDQDNILLYRNFKLPEPIDSLNPMVLPAKNLQFLKERLAKLKSSRNKIEIKIDSNTIQYLYYEDSTTLRRLSMFPYIQLAVLLLFLAIAYFALISVKKAEQNKVWVGLSKETAHQLGTPISALKGWTQLLETIGDDSQSSIEQLQAFMKDVSKDMDKDVNRLAVIADRFSKIGSMPEKELTFINEAVERGISYMQDRIPNKIILSLHLSDDVNCGVMICQPLFEWVMENLTKNAVDAMGGAQGKIDVTVKQQGHLAIIWVKDTGKGILRKNFKTVFSPGFTTKKRGWGLGLTLVKRIIEDYHNGKIYVKESELGKGTTFCIELPIVQ